MGFGTGTRTIPRVRRAGGPGLPSSRPQLPCHSHHTGPKSLPAPELPGHAAGRAEAPRAARAKTGASARTGPRPPLQAPPLQAASCPASLSGQVALGDRAAYCHQSDWAAASTSGKSGLRGPG